MITEIKKAVPDWTDMKALEDYLRKILNKEAFDKTGLIYGMGHAVYTESDPRCEILKECARNLAKEKDVNFNSPHILNEYILERIMLLMASPSIAPARAIYAPRYLS